MATILERAKALNRGTGGFAAPLETDFLSPIHIISAIADPESSEELALFGLHIAVLNLLPANRPSDTDRVITGNKFINQHDIAAGWKMWDDAVQAGNPPTIAVAMAIDGPPRIDEITLEEVAITNMALSVLFANRNAMNQVALDLMIASANKALNKQNYRSYAAMVKGSFPAFGDCMALFKWGAPFFTELLESADGRALMTKCDWAEYHTSFSSVGSLCDRIFSMIPESMTHIVSTADRNAVKAAKGSPWDRELARAVSNNALALVEIFVRELDLKVGRFYMGERALASISPLEEKKLRTLCTQIIKKDATISSMQASRSLDDVYTTYTGAPDDLVEAAKAARALRDVAALSALNRREKVKKARADAAAAGAPFILTMDQVTRGDLNAVPDDEL